MYTLVVDYKGPIEVRTLARLAFFRPPVQRYILKYQVYSSRGILLGYAGIHHIDFEAAQVPSDKPTLENAIKSYVANHIARTDIRKFNVMQHHGPQLFPSFLEIDRIGSDSVDILVQAHVE